MKEYPDLQRDGFAIGLTKSYTLNPQEQAQIRKVVEFATQYKLPKKTSRIEYILKIARDFSTSFFH
jgi:hypothetical protein